MAKIVDVEGIGAVHGAKLQTAGVASTAALLREGATKAGRTKLAQSTGLSEKLILEWVNHADLMRIKGVGSEYSDLLEAAGVDSVPELSKRVPANLHAKLAEVNATKKLVRQLPSEKAVAGWVTQAGSMEKIVKH